MLCLIAPLVATTTSENFQTLLSIVILKCVDVSDFSQWKAESHDDPVLSLLEAAAAHRVGVVGRGQVGLRQAGLATATRRASDERHDTRQTHRILSLQVGVGYGQLFQSQNGLAFADQR